VSIDGVLNGSERWTVECGDASEFSESLPADSVDLLLTDPPFFKVKDEAWDRQWDAPAEFLSWIGGLLDKWRRVLKPNGSLYVFASPQMAARVEVEVGQRFAVLNHVVWCKPPYSTKAEMFVKGDLRSFFPASERIVFAEQTNAENHASGESGYSTACGSLHCEVYGKAFGDYMRTEIERSGVSRKEVAALFPSRTGNPTGCVSNWLLGYNCPTPEQYEAIRELLNRFGGQYLRREYEDLRREYEDLRRPFSVTEDVPYTDVWTFPTVQSYPGKHPCEKPEELVAHIINASSKPDAVVCDCFAGSGVVGAVAVALGRRFIGCELDPLWVERAQARIQVGRKLRAPEPKATDKRQGSLFGDSK
jgi:site-specific DNA-methyltransferase (adenine-specific)